MSITLIFDTETTGLKDPEPVEIGYIRLGELTQYPEGLIGPTHETYQERFSTSKPIEAGATKIHKITNACVAGKPHWDSFTFPPGVQYLVGHVITFDAKVMGYPEFKYICTRDLAKRLWPELPNYKLTTIIETKFPAIGKRLTKDAHGALVDCKLCLLIIHQAMQEFEGIDSWQALHDLAGVFPKKAVVKELTTMPWGMHKGKSFEEVPQDYLRWVIEDSTASQEVKTAVRKHYHGN